MFCSRDLTLIGLILVLLIGELIFTIVKLAVCIQCHKAKNLVPEAGGQATRTGEAVLEIQVSFSRTLGMCTIWQLCGQSSYIWTKASFI
jgi:hypothetical protein